jgi:CubicO group peptidase (beta-lactamase class C family)
VKSWLFCLAASAALAISTPDAVQPAGRFGLVAPRMQQFVDAGEAAGIVTLVATSDTVLHLSAVGKTDRAGDRRMKPDDIFWIASMTKPITAVAVALLVDDATLAFDDKVERYLPEFAGLQLKDDSGQLVKPARAITLRDVLTHTSGMSDVNRRDPHLTLEQTSRRIAQEPLIFQPGSRWSYSTAGIDVIGRVVEVASGMPFDRFLQKRVFDPLGMKDTSFWIDRGKYARWAHPYQWVAEEHTLRETAISFMYGTEVTDRQRPPLGGAGLFSTAGDIARFYQMMLSKGQANGRRLLEPGTVVELTRKQTGDLRARPGMPWGLGFCLVEDPTAIEANGILSAGSFGHGGAYSTQSWADPAKNLIWVLMFERTGKGNPDNSDIRIAFQEAVGK